MIGLYLHVPFCESICSYCNFNRGLLDADLKVRYVRALEQEIEALGAETESIDRKLIEAAGGAADASAIAAMNKRRAEIAARIEAAEARWYELQDALSAFDNA